MSDVLLLLRLEHKTFNDLLNLIDEQRRNLEQGDDVDINLLQSVAEYFTGHPDECHHPVEELVLRQLRMRNPGVKTDLERLSKEHREIEHLTELLATTLTRTLSGRDAQTPEVREVMQQFVDYYRNHMMMEEKYVFRAAAEALSKEDWDAIEFSLFDRDDPLFDYAAHERYQRLREEIGRSAAESGRRASQLRWAKRVQRLGTISGFNDSMQKLGTDCLLVHHPEGGYTLALDGQAVMEIPECSEEQAICSAYYVLQERER